MAKGRVEIRLSNDTLGQWSTICDNFNAAVICRQLGYSNGIASRLAYVRTGTGTMWLDNLHCRGNETRQTHVRTMDGLPSGFKNNMLFLKITNDMLFLVIFGICYLSFVINYFLSIIFLIKFWALFSLKTQQSVIFSYSNSDIQHNLKKWVTFVKFCFPFARKMKDQVKIEKYLRNALFQWNFNVIFGLLKITNDKCYFYKNDK